MDRTRQLCTATTIHDAIRLDEVARDAHGIVERALRLVDDHVVATADEDGDGTRVGALLNDEHAVLCRAKPDFAHAACAPELLGRELRKAGHNAPPRCNGEELNLNAAHPPHRRQPVLQQQVVCLIVKAPLADDHVRARCLDLCNHLREVRRLLCLQRLVRLGRCDVKPVLCLRLGGLKGAREDGDLCPLHHLRHLRV